MPNAILIKPLDGQPEGTEREFDQPDFDRLVTMNAIKAAPARADKAAPPAENKMEPKAENKDVTKPPRAKRT